MHLFGLLRGVGRVQLFQAGTIGVAIALAALVIFALLAIFADALFALPTALRIGLSGVALLGTAWATGWLGYRWFQLRFDPRLVARQVECRLNLSDNLLINAVEFAAASPAGDSPVLRDRVVRLAEERARELSALEVLPFRPVWRALGGMLLASLVALGCWLAAPRLFATVVPRFIDPRGDHPPFTLVTFDIAIAPEPVYHGRPATITATFGGPEQVKTADVVFLDDANAVTAREPLRAPMFRQEEQTFVLELERAEQSRRFYIDTPKGRSATQDLVVTEVPFIEEVTVRYEYPAYTGWTALDQPLDARGLRGLVGTTAVITASSNLPLSSGRFEMTTQAAGAAQETFALSPLPNEPQRVQGRIPLKTSGRFSLTLKATSGGESFEPFTGTVAVTPDRAPRVAIVQPQPHVIVVEDWQVPVVIEAVDDVGIAGLRFSRSVNGWGPSTVALPFESHRSGAVRATTEFDLAALGARAGDLITYYATAADNHPDPTQFADSETCVIQVISEEEYVQFARQQYQVDELAAEFAAIQERLDELQHQREAALAALAEAERQLAENPDNPELQQKLEAAQKELEQLSEQAESLAKKLAERAEQMQLYDLEQPYTDGLKTLAKQLQQQSDAAQAVAEALERLRKEGSTPANRESLQQAADALRSQQQGLDQEAQDQREATQEDLELVQMADRMLAQSERLNSIVQQQRELATRLGEFQNQPSISPQEQQRADQLARQQELLEQELQDVAQELEAGADAAQDPLPKMSASAREIIEAIRSEQIPEDQQQAAAQARQGAVRDAHQRADSAAVKLEALAQKCSSCQSAAGEMAGQLDGPLSLSLESLQQSLEQMAQGRGLPGLPRQDSGDGQGQQSGSSGSGQSGESGQSTGGTGQNQRWRPGQTFPGSQSRTPILGPRTLVEQEPSQPGGQLGGNHRGTFAPGLSGDPLGEAEVLTPEARAHRATSAGNLRGVPVPYRKDAEAYFRRLAEDEAAK